MQGQLLPRELISQHVYDLQLEVNQLRARVQTLERLVSAQGLVAGKSRRSEFSDYQYEPLNPKSYSLHPPYLPKPTPYTLNPPYLPNPKPSTLNLKLCTLNPP